MIERRPAEEALLARLDEFFDGVYAPLEAWLPRLQQDLGARLARGPVSGGQLVALVENEARSVLDTVDRPIYGAGYCASPVVVSEGNPLAWWQGAERTLLASSTFGPGQAAIDLHRLEWYRVPAESSERHVAGPFVDYLCSNEITLTAALPVTINGEFGGVICADVLVASIEDLLLPTLAEYGGTAIVNANDRVLVSVDSRFETGDRFSAGGQTTRSRKYPFALRAAV